MHQNARIPIRWATIWQNNRLFICSHGINIFIIELNLSPRTHAYTHLLTHLLTYLLTIASLLHGQ